MAVTVQLQTGASTSTVLSNVIVAGLPSSVRFGLSAATGALWNTHEVRNFSLVSGSGSGAAAVPALSHWGVVALATLLLLGSLVALRRR